MGRDEVGDDRPSDGSRMNEVEEKVLRVAHADQDLGGLVERNPTDSLRKSRT